MSIVFERLCLIGGGLIGSSIARAAREKNAARQIIIADHSADVTARIKALGIADLATQDLAAAVSGADCVILCVPVGVCGKITEAIAPHLKQGAILSDAGSVKGAIIRDCAPHVPEGVHFIPAHPVAGTEHSGPDAGFAALFVNRWCILTPPEGTDASAIARLEAFWRALGANLEIMTPQHHDLVLAITSHVPHLIAYNIVGTADDLEMITEGEVIKFSAGGFRDFTRIAASDPVMWRDVFLHNKPAVLEMVARFSEDLAALARMIRWDDAEGLHALFTRTREIRRSIIASGQESAEPNFGRDKPPQK